MLLYHPVHDPYHAAYRALRLLVASETGSLQTLVLRILDYYLLFPAEVEHIQMPMQLRSWKLAFRSRRNKYFSTVSKHSVFRQLAGPQEVGTRLLASRGLITVSSSENRHMALHREAMPLSLLASIIVANEQDADLILFLTDNLAKIEVSGPMGLKKRTGLAEHRYDIA
jgi:hypothetical protein